MVLGLMRFMMGMSIFVVPSGVTFYGIKQSMNSFDQISKQQLS